MEIFENILRNVNSVNIGTPHNIPNICFVTFGLNSLPEGRDVWSPPNLFYSSTVFTQRITAQGQRETKLRPDARSQIVSVDTRGEGVKVFSYALSRGRGNSVKALPGQWTGGPATCWCVYAR